MKKDKKKPRTSVKFTYNGWGRIGIGKRTSINIYPDLNHLLISFGAGEYSVFLEKPVGYTVHGVRGTREGDTSIYYVDTASSGVRVCHAHLREIFGRIPNHLYLLKH